MAKFTRFLIIGDLHGTIPQIELGDCDAILCPGDLADFGEIRDIMFKLMREESKDKWYDVIGKEKAKELIDSALEGSKKILDYLDSFGIPVFIVPGNVDFYERDSEWEYERFNHFDKILTGYKNIINCHEKCLKFRDLNIIGYGLSCQPEITRAKELRDKLSPREIKEEKENYNRTSDNLKALFNEAKKPIIFLSHNVPFNTSLDCIESKESPMYGFHFGSLITREFVDDFQPLLCIGGHMHEHFKSEKLGNTLCINSGSGFSGQRVKVEIKSGEIVSVKFIER